MKKHNRLISMVVGVALLVTSLAFTAGGFLPGRAGAVEDAGSDEKRIAGDISNMTGAAAEEILRLRSRGKDWNEILETLKNGKDNQAERDQRSSTLLQTDLDGNYIEQRRKEGFSEEEIMEAKLLSERVVFQLQEITFRIEPKDLLPKPEAEKTGEKDDIALYSELAGKIDIRTSVYLLLKLKKDYDSLEKVFDEYLLALQAGINLEMRLADRQAYENEKNEKLQGMDTQKIITLAKIEERMLKKIQDDNSNMRNETMTGPNTGDLRKSVENKSPLPEIPQTAPKSVKPENPNESILKEIRQINPLQDKL